MRGVLPREAGSGHELVSSGVQVSVCVHPVLPTKRQDALPRQT